MANTPYTKMHRMGEMIALFYKAPSGRKVCELADLLGCHRSTIKEYIDILRQEGLVYARGIEHTKRDGRPSIIWSWQFDGVFSNQDIEIPHGHH